MVEEAGSLETGEFLPKNSKKMKAKVRISLRETTGYLKATLGGLIGNLGRTSGYIGCVSASLYCLPSAYNYISGFGTLHLDASAMQSFLEKC